MLCRTTLSPEISPVGELMTEGTATPQSARLGVESRIAWQNCTSTDGVKPPPVTVTAWKLMSPVPGVTVKVARHERR